MNPNKEDIREMILWAHEMGATEDRDRLLEAFKVLWPDEVPPVIPKLRLVRKDEKEEIKERWS